MRSFFGLLDMVFPREHHGHGGHQHDHDHSKYKSFLQGRVKPAAGESEALKDEKHQGHHAQENVTSEKEALPKEEGNQ